MKRRLKNLLIIVFYVGSVSQYALWELMEKRDFLKREEKRRGTEMVTANIVVHYPN